MGGAAEGVMRGLMMKQNKEQAAAELEEEQRRRRLQEILTQLELRQLPGVDLQRPDEPIPGRSTPVPMPDGPLGGFEVPDPGPEGESDRFAMNPDIDPGIVAGTVPGRVLPFDMPGSATPDADRLESESERALEGADFRNLSELSDEEFEDLGTIELGGREHRLLFDPEAAAREANREQIEERQRQRGAYNLLHAQEPEEFPEYVEGFDYLDELDEVMSEGRERTFEREQTESERERERTRTARQDRAFSMFKQGRSFEQVQEATGLPAEELVDVRSDVQSLEDTEEDPVMENVLDLVEPRDDFEMEIARRIRAGQSEEQVLTSIASDVADSAGGEINSERVASEIERLQQKARSVFDRVRGSDDTVMIQGSFESLQGLGLGG